MGTQVFGTNALCLPLAIAMLLCLPRAGDAAPEVVTVDAAYTSPSFLYLISGQKILYISRAIDEERITFDIYQPGKLTKLDIQAAFSDPDISRQIVTYYGSKYGLRVKSTGNQRVKKIKYESDDRAPRAAARKGDEIYLFRKNKVAFAVNFTTWDEAENVKNYPGMPKDITAAWNDGDGMYLLKGNKMWRWNEDNSVSAPINFHDKYIVRSWILSP